MCVILRWLPSPTSSKPAPIGAILDMALKNKRLLVIFAVLAGLIILFGARRKQAVVPKRLGNFGASRLPDWIPGPSDFFKTTQRKTIIHPIPKLMANAQAKFKKMIAGQSKTLADAVKEYKRRYGRNPPKGFDEWFDFAKENGAKIIDEYDQIVRDLEPFWGMSGEELRRRATQVRGGVSFAIQWSQAEILYFCRLKVGQLPSIDLVRLENGTAIAVNIQKGFNDSEVGARARGLVAMVQKFQQRVRVNAHVHIMRTNVHHSYRIWSSPSMPKQRGGSSFLGNILNTQI